MKKLYVLYILIATEGLSLLGSRMWSIAISIWLYQTKGNVTYLLLIPLFNELPPIVFGNLAGMVVDRWKRKYVMIFGDAAQALCSLILWLIVATNNFQVWHLYIIVAMQGAFSMFQGLAADASTTLLAPKEYISRINAIKEITFPAAGVVAPAFSGFLYAAAGLKGVILFDLITFIISVLVLLNINIPDPSKSDISLEYNDGFLKEAIGGFKYLLWRKELLQLILYFSFINLMINGPLELVIPYVLKIGGNQLLVSVLLGVMNFGALVGACMIVFRGEINNKVKCLIYGMIINGVMFIIFGVTRIPLLLVISLFVLMIPLPISNALFKSVIQTKTAPDIQGRVFAVISQLENIGSTASFLITGPLVERILEPAANNHNWVLFGYAFYSKPSGGIGLLFSLTGLAILIVTVIVYMQPKIRNLDLMP